MVTKQLPYTRPGGELPSGCFETLEDRTEIYIYIYVCMFQHIQLAYMHACMRLDTLGRMPNTRGLRLRVFVHACLYHPQGVLDPEPSTTHHPNKHQAGIVNTTPLRSVLSNNA